MIVDDDHHILKYCEAILSNNGHEVILRSDPESALETLRAHAVDLLVVDVIMPTSTGFDFLKAVKKLKTAAPPILMLTRKSSPKDVITALELGATDYMVKPFDRDVFIAKVESIIGGTSKILEVKFAASSTNAKAHITINALITQITEMGLTLRTHNYIEKNFRIMISSKVFQEMGIQCPPLRAVSCRPIEGDTEYQYEIFVSFIGLDEPTMKKIRVWVANRAILMRKVA